MSAKTIKKITVVLKQHTMIQTTTEQGKLLILIEQQTLIKLRNSTAIVLTTTELSNGMTLTILISKSFDVKMYLEDFI